MIKTVMIAWIAIPLFVRFAVYLRPRLAQLLTLAVTLLSMCVELCLAQLLTLVVTLLSMCVELFQIMPILPSVKLVDRFGVSRLIDQMSGYFIRFLTCCNPLCSQRIFNARTV